MFKSLPQRPSLDQLRRQAKDLLLQLRQGDPSALERLRRNHPDFRNTGDASRPPAGFSLNHAQLVVAREHGFASWTRLKRQVELLALDGRERRLLLVHSALFDHGDPKAANFERARALVEADPEIARTTFHTALVTGEVTTIVAHLKQEPELALKKGGPKDWPPLLYVCFSRFFHRDESRSQSFAGIIRALLAAGADPNTFFMVNDDPNARQTCLYGAAGIANNAVVTKLLLDAGADPNDAAPGFGPESLYHAAEHQNVDCLRLILEAGPHPDKVSYCLGRCLDFENPAGVKLFLEAGADPDFVPPGVGDRSTRLHGAIRNGRGAEVIRLLLDAGADWTRTNREGMTAYRAAVRTGHREAAARMERLGADPESASEADRFIGACLAADSDRAFELRNANPNLIAGMRPSDLAMISVAAYLQRPDAVRLMVGLGFPLNAYGPEHMTALHWAGWNGDADLARFLIQHGADTELQNGYGGTVLGCTVWAAIHRGVDIDYAPVVRVLLDAGAVTRDKCNYPTRIAAIDALLRPHLETKAAGRGADHVGLLAGPMDVISRRLPDRATVQQLIGAWAESLLTEYAAKSPWTAVVLSNWSPTLVAKSAAEIFRSKLSESDARDAAARYFGYDSWKQVENESPRRPDPVFESAVDAVIAGDIDKLGGLLADFPDLIIRRSAFGHHCTLLHYVAANGVEIHRQTVPPNAVEIARALLDAGADPDALADTYGGGPNQTTLSLLVTSAHPHEAGLVEPLIELLVEHGADVDGVDRSGHPLQAALDFGHTQTAEALVRNGAGVFTVSQAAGVGRAADLIRLLSPKPDSKQLDKALYLAARNGRMNCLKPLVEAGADLNARGWFGGPALHWAAINGHAPVVEFLLNQGADPNLRDDRFRANAAGWANENGHAAIRDLLLANGCAATIVEAAAFGRTDLVRKQLSRDPASVNANEGRTPLHEAAGRGNMELARLLLKHGADPEACDADGLKPSDWARAKGHDDLVRLLT